MPKNNPNNKEPEKQEKVQPVLRHLIHPTVAGKKVDAHVLALDPSMTKEERISALTEFYVSLLPENYEPPLEEVQMFIENAENLTPVEGLGGGVGAQKIGGHYALVMTGNVYKDKAKTKLDNDKLKNVVRQRLEILEARTLGREKAEEDKKKQQIRQDLQADLQKEVKKAAEKLADQPFLSGLPLKIDGVNYVATFCLSKETTPEKQNEEFAAYYDRVHGGKNAAPNDKDREDFLKKAAELTVKEGEKTAVTAVRSGDRILVVVKGDFYKRENGEIVGYDDELLKKLAEESVRRLKEAERQSDEIARGKEQHAAPPDEEPANYRSLPEQTALHEQIYRDLYRDENELEERTAGVAPAAEKKAEKPLEKIEEVPEQEDEPDL